MARRFGIAHAGEMGAAVGAALVARGHEVVTATHGRGEATRRRAADAGLEDVGELTALLDRVDCVLSIVPPHAAVALAEQVASRATQAPRADALVFVDLNSIGPETARVIATRLGESGVRFVDGSIHGQARHLATRARVYLSGPDAESLAQSWRGALDVVALGESPDAASMCKMLLGSLSKTLVASFLQTGLLAEAGGTLAPFLEQARHFYPGILEAVERMAPTYPTHARRRVDELSELEDTMRARGLRAGTASESRRFVEEIANVLSLLPRDADASLENLIEALAALGVLRAGPDAEPDPARQR